MELHSGAAGAKGAVYRQTVAGPGGRPVAADFEIIEARTGAEIQYQVIVGPARPHGGYYLSTEGRSTRVRFALNCEPQGIHGPDDEPVPPADEGRGRPARAAQVGPRRYARAE